MIYRYIDKDVIKHFNTPHQAYHYINGRCRHGITDGEIYCVDMEDSNIVMLDSINDLIYIRNINTTPLERTSMIPTDNGNIIEYICDDIVYYLIIKDK